MGVRADGKVIFAISQGEVSFDAFARLFRDGLNCPNALFLDGGSASSLYAPSLNSHGNILLAWSDAGCIRNRLKSHAKPFRRRRTLVTLAAAALANLARADLPWTIGKHYQMDRQASVGGKMTIIGAVDRPMPPPLDQRKATSCEEADVIELPFSAYRLISEDLG